MSPANPRKGVCVCVGVGVDVCVGVFLNFVSPLNFTEVIMCDS